MKYIWVQVLPFLKGSIEVIVSKGSIFNINNKFIHYLVFYSTFL